MDAIGTRVARLALEQKVRLLTGADFWSTYAEPAVGLRRIVMSDGPAGVRGETWDDRDTSANVPSPTALAATWDEERIERLGELLAAEARRKGVDIVLAPTINLHRSPYGGRHFECYSEDPHLTARIGAAYVRGLQQHGVAATVKHFVANDSETERMTLDARIDERTLRELYLAPFEELVRAGAWAIMAAYNQVNGTTMTESPLLQEILKDEWGFDGVVMSDWTATRSTEATANAGLDLAMPGPTSPWGDQLVTAVREGRVGAARIDDKITRLLRLADRVEAPASPPPAWNADDIAAELRGTAAAGFVLARNENEALPLEIGTLHRIAVVGPNAATARTLGGGSATVFPPYAISPLHGIRAALGESVRVDHSIGVRATERIAPAATDLVTDPDTGEPGISVRLVADDGRVIATEHRQTGKLMMFGTPTEGVAAVELHARIEAKTSGAYAVGASGIGVFRLTADDDELFDTTLTRPEGADIIEGMMRPPQQVSGVELEAGQHTDLVLRHPVAADAFAILCQLNVEPPRLTDEEELARAVAMARDADAAVVVVGTTDEVESEGFDRDSLALPGRQDELVRRVAGVNPRTVVVVNAGAPVLLPWTDGVPAILLCWFPGQEFGHALADVLLGRVEPGGRLPTTWPVDESGPLPSTRPSNGILSYDEGLHIGHRAYERASVEPRFWFGHGLGYTTWHYTHLHAPATIDSDEDVVVRVGVRNTGNRTGREVVQIYASRADSAVDRPAHWLIGFACVEAESGADTAVEITVPARAFAHWDGGWQTEPGAFQIAAGRSVHDLRLHIDLVIA